YLVPMIGLGSVSAAAWFDRVSRGRSLGWLAAGLLSVLVVMQLPTVLANTLTPYYRAQVARGKPQDNVYLVETWQGSTYFGAWNELGQLTRHTLRGEPVPRGRLAEIADVPTALEQAEVLNTFQPWWLRLAQTGRVTGATAAGLYALVGLLVLVAGFALGVATSAFGRPGRERMANARLSIVNARPSAVESNDG
ncbi:MAG TPA: hypothetical protein VF937_16540, partial [Chloroflexota bacterium]